MGQGSGDFLACWDTFWAECLDAQGEEQVPAALDLLALWDLEAALGIAS